MMPNVFSSLHFIDQTFNLKGLKKSLLAGVLLLLFLIPADALWVYFHQESQRRDVPKAFVEIQTPETLESLDFYTAPFKTNTLFGKVTADREIFVPQTSIADLVKDFRLKGVILAGEASEAIVEDAKTQKTSFLKKSTSFKNLTVKDIGEGFIVFSLGEEEVSLEIQ